MSAAIQAAMRVQAFIKDDAIAAAMGRLERKYYEEFKQSKSSEDRVRSWAKASVLDDFLNELQIVIDTGEREVLEAAKAASRATPPSSKEK